MMEDEIKKLQKIMSKKDRKKWIIVILIVLIILILLLLTEEKGKINKVGDEGIWCEEEVVINSVKAEEVDCSKYEDENYINDFMNMHVESEEGYDEQGKVNMPKLDREMIPVYYDGNVWRKADKTNKDEKHKWYDYTNTDKKQWANVVTIEEEYSKLGDTLPGAEIPIDKITAFFVWIPRYAYNVKIESKEVTDVNQIKFLKGNTDIDIDGNICRDNYTKYHLEQSEELMVVHPAFKFGGADLRGIWVAKFEASGTNELGQAVGNYDYETEKVIEPDESTYVKILPSKVSWRNITIGESQYQCMIMRKNREAYGWSTWVNSHLMKNEEWDAVVRLCYSEYGNVPLINGSGSMKTEKFVYNMYTGAGPNTKDDMSWYGKLDGVDVSEQRKEFTEETHGYNTPTGMLASTTGNVYGIYDLSGGAWERVASYIECENDNLNIYTKSTTNIRKAYFENAQPKLEYINYWSKYNLENEEQKNKLIETGEVFLRRGEYFANESYNTILSYAYTIGNQADNQGFRPVLAF